MTTKMGKATLKMADVAGLVPSASEMRRLLIVARADITRRDDRFEIVLRGKDGNPAALAAVITQRLLGRGGRVATQGETVRGCPYWICQWRGVPIELAAFDDRIAVMMKGSATGKSEAPIAGFGAAAPLPPRSDAALLAAARDDYQAAAGALDEALTRFGTAAGRLRKLETRAEEIRVEQMAQLMLDIRGSNPPPPS